MRSQCVIIARAAAVIVLTVSGASAQTAPPGPNAAPAPDASRTPALPLMQATAFGMDDLMTLLVQPRHMKLYLAGSARNWELAAAESRGLRSSFDRIGGAIPWYLTNNVPKSVTSLIAPQLQAVDTAIAKADTQQFAAAFGALTSACNACHAYMEHPYVVIKVPQATGRLVYPDQVFGTQP